jgi:hypothetical protein
MTDAPKPNRRGRTCLWIVLAGAGSICLIMAACVVISTISQQSSPAGTLPLYVCAGWTTTPTTQVGIAWASPVVSYHPPIMSSPTAVCGNIPFLGTLFPGNLVGQIAFPP